MFETYGAITGGLHFKEEMASYTLIYSSNIYI
jgi:hypothetical protein